MTAFSNVDIEMLLGVQVITTVGSAQCHLPALILDLQIRAVLATICCSYVGWVGLPRRRSLLSPCSVSTTNESPSPSFFLCLADTKRGFFIGVECRDCQMRYSTASAMATTKPTNSPKRARHSFFHPACCDAHQAANPDPPTLSIAFMSVVMVLLSLFLSASISSGSRGGT